MTTAEIQKQDNSPISFMQKESVKQRFKEMMGNRSNAFLSSVLAAVNSNNNLKRATPESVYMAAMMAATLDLPINQNLGFAYIIPYKTKDADGNFIDVAQFQMGYKGFIQLAQRSGQYKTISASPVYEGQLISQDPLKGFEFDWTNRKSDALIGYAGYFALTNGFEKTLFMTIDDLQKHGAKYSKTFSQTSSKWKTDFEAMAMKTVIKLLISKYGPLSVDVQMQKAVISDQAVINDADTLDVTYVDAETRAIPEPPSKDQAETDRLIAMIQAAKSIKDLNAVRKHITGNQVATEAFLTKETELEAVQANA